MAAPAAPKRVRPDEILAAPAYSTRSVSGLQRLSGLQQAAFLLAIGTGVLIMFIVLVDLGWAAVMAPAPPALPFGANDAALRADLIASYDKLSKAHWTDWTSILQPVIWGGFLPVFTLLLGYLFGAQVEKT